MFYSEELLEEIRSRNDIVDVISENVMLKKKGASYFGLCPFHNEKSPSFSVTPGKQMYHCFGCGEGGNVFSYVMKYENFTFIEAAKMLAERAGIDLPEMEYSEEEKMRANLKSKLLEINKIAAKYFYFQLKTEKGKIGYEYFKSRGLDDDTILKFGLGYSNKTSNDLYKYLIDKGYKDDELKESGLITFSEKGTYDKFWNRVMFPILDTNSRVIGFGGRVMGEGEPKYLNSPETKVFEKSRNLYGLNYARISREDYLLICEGYMDVIALHKAGFTNAVAALGTAFTQNHAMLIKRYFKNVVLTFDSDGAGKKAALRAIPILKSVGGISIKVLNMSPYKDPDEFIKNEGAEEYKKRIDNAINGFMFELKMLEGEYDMGDPQQKSEFYSKVVSKLLEFRDDLERNVYTEAVSKEFNIPLDILMLEVKKQALLYKGDKQNDWEDEEKIDNNIMKRKSNKLEDGTKQAQKILLTWMIEDEVVCKKILEYITEDDFVDELYHKVASMLFEQCRKGELNPARILNNFMEEDEHRRAAELFNTSLREQMSDKEKEKTLNDTVQKVKKHSLEFKSKHVTDIKVLQEIMAEQKKLQKLHITL